MSTSRFLISLSDKFVSQLKSSFSGAESTKEMRESEVVEGFDSVSDDTFATGAMADGMAASSPDDQTDLRADPDVDIGDVDALNLSGPIDAPVETTTFATVPSIAAAPIETDNAAMVATTGPIVSIEGEAVVESSSNYVRFVVSLSEASQGAVSFEYRTILSGSASDADLYYTSAHSANNGTVTLAPGETSAEIFIPLGHDTVDEFDEDFELELYNIDGATFENDQETLSAKGIILDNDGAGPNDAILVSDPTLVEGDSGTQVMRFEVRLSRPASESTTVSYETVDGGAEAGEDYQATSGNLTFAAGQEVAYVDVTVFGDTLQEFGETFDLVVTPPNPDVLNTDSAAGTATILDDDAASGPIVTMTSEAVAESSSNYVRFVVSLSEASQGAVSFEYRTILSGSASDADLYYTSAHSANNGTVTLAPGETSAEIFIPLGHDTVDEFDEDFELELYNIDGATFENDQETLSAKGVILDNDGAGPNVSLFVSDYTLTEGGYQDKTYDITVTLSQPATTETKFALSLQGGTGDVPGDIALVDDTVTFEAGQTTAVVRVTVKSDTVEDEGEVTFLSFEHVSGMPVGDINTSRIELLDGGTFTNDDDEVELSDSDDVGDALDGDDVVNALAGNDEIFGNDGDDTLNGNAGNDVLSGGNDNDTLSGGKGADELNGDGGSDTIYGDGGLDTINGGSGGDTLFGNSSNDVVHGDGGHDAIDGGQGFDELYGDGGHDVIEGKDGQDTIYGGEGDDTLNGNAGGDTIFGGDGADEINGGKASDVLYGDDDQDILQGKNGEDILYGGAHADELYGNSGADTLFGQGGSDELYGGQSTDMLDGGGGNDILNGDNGGDTLFGGAGNDILYGNAGADTLNGGAGDDILFGGKSTDTFIFTEGADVIEDYSNGFDTIEIDAGLYNLSDENEVFDLATEVNGDVVFDFGSGNTLTVIGISDVDLLNGSLSLF